MNKIVRNAIKITNDVQVSKQIFKDAMILEFEKLYPGVPYNVRDVEGDLEGDVWYAVEVKEC